MVEQGWTPSEVTQVHLHDLVNQGFMMAVELATYRVPEDPASPASAEEYIVVFAVFYEWGFGVLSHWFFYSLLQYYSMELHHLTPSGILHITTFVTLCEAYMGIDPHFIMWNYFLDAEAAVLEGVVIHVKSKHDVDPYFDLPMSESTDGW
jgi:hypothetical protein